VLAATATVAVAVAVIATSAGGKAQSDRRAHLQHLIERDDRFLARQGIFIRETGIAASCVLVRVANPTAPNVAYLRQRYGGPMCVQRVSMPNVRCPGAVVPPKGEIETREVPRLLDLGIYEAERRAIAAGFEFTTSCPGVGESRAKPVPRLTPLSSARITAQCPLAGSRARVDVPIALQAEAVLPGNFTYTTTAFLESFRAPRCVDGWPR
jgi:hypothetical protein